MSAESPRHARSGGPLTVPAQPPSDRSIIDAVSGFINDVTLSSSSNVDPKDVIQWARFETADINEPTPEGDSDTDVSPLLLILGYGSGVQVWLVPPSGEAQEVLSWRQGTVRVLRILPTPHQADCFASKRPLIALCDSASPGPAFCSLSFISIRGGEQVKSIKFKNPILDVLANKRSVVVSFSERFAVFDAATLEDRLAVTTCYPCPCPLGGTAPINPLALGDRWLAYADKKLNPSKRSSGGCEGEGVTSYTATVLHAAKSLSKGLRGLGESVAHSLAGGRTASQSPSPPHADIQQPGVVTILDIEGNEDEDSQDCEEPCDPIVAHFVAHSEAIIALKFDPSGMLLVTADRRGHDFHVFRINPHPCGPSLASVHHLYILHRGDTTAKVQDIAISCDSRWAAVSTLRGTTHVFAVSPYGGACGVRTHTQPRVVNRLSRFHRSAGLPIHAAHASVCEGASVGGGGAGAWFPNPRLPPYPLPVTSAPLAQLRPTHNLPTHTITRTSSGRQRLSSLSEESGAAPLLARACFGGGSAAGRASALSLYLVAASGSLLHLLLHPRPARGVPKEKICDESPIEVEVEGVAQWPLQRPAAAADLLAPLPPSNPLLQPLSCRRCADMCMSEEERWLSQVEIVTHAGPHRRLWMGPQFVFKTYNCTGSSSSLSEAETVEVEARGAARSTPVNMPGVRPVVPVLVDSGSASSLEHSPSDSFRRKSLLADGARAAGCDVQLREDLAEAMKEDHGWPRDRSRGAARGAAVARAVDPLGTVVAWPEPAEGPPEPDPDLHTSSNADEATFRPVVRAPAPAALAPLVPLLHARPLPAHTTIPVQTVAPERPRPAGDPRPLPATTTIPVQTITPPDLEPDHDPRPLPATTTIPVQTVAPRPLLPAALRPPAAPAAPVAPDPLPPAAPVPAPVPAERCETETSLPKSNRPSDDIQPTARSRVKKSPTVKSASDRIAGGASVKDRKVDDENSKSFERDSDRKGSEMKASERKVGEKKAAREDEQFKKLPPSKYEISNEDAKESSRPASDRMSKLDQRKPVVIEEDASPAPDALVPNFPREDLKSQISFSSKPFEIKTEEQAWDMLLSEPEKTALPPPPPPAQVDSSSNEKVEVLKIKPKKNRKNKKSQEELQLQADEDSFIEIHAIEEKQQEMSGDLVSISTPFEEETSHSFASKSRKSRTCKSRTPEIKDDGDIKFDEVSQQGLELSRSKRKGSKIEDISCDIVLDEISTTVLNPKQASKETVTGDNDSSKAYVDTTPSISLRVKDSFKSNKSKSPSPNLDGRKSADNEEKEVYVINTTEEDFPEIQITRGKAKRSPQPGERKLQDNDTAEKQIKSWSSIAATKSGKKVEETDTKAETAVKEKGKALPDKECDIKSSGGISLQDKLAELYKRTDIMIAECDEPTQLNFVEEHHAVLRELPPLEPLDFGLDDFKLEVMRDSLLEVADTKITSPICKISIDDILSTIKETTTKVIESSTFNLIDIEKVPAKKEKGFSVVEPDKITTQEIKIDDEVKSDRDNDIEKSSDDCDDGGSSPILSTDSDKEDKSNVRNIKLPSRKDSFSKKSDDGSSQSISIDNDKEEKKSLYKDRLLSRNMLAAKKGDDGSSQSISIDSDKEDKKSVQRVKLPCMKNVLAAKKGDGASQSTSMNSEKKASSSRKKRK